MPADRDLLMIIVGGDALALSTARELSLLQGRRIVVLWPADLEFASAVRRSVRNLSPAGRTAALALKWPAFPMR